MPYFGNTPGFKSLSDSSGTQTKKPELPPERRWRHSATNSKLVSFCLVRITPMGLPVQASKSSFHVQVSGSPLTLAKSLSPNERQPGLVPSIKALGKGFDC